MNNIQYMKKSCLASLLAFFAAYPCYSQDLQSEFNKGSTKQDQVLIKNKKIIDGSKVIRCGIFPDMGPLIYRIGDDIYKNDDGSEYTELKKVASSKKGNFQWKQKYMVSYQERMVPFQLVASSDNSYSVYFKPPDMPTWRAACNVLK
jgi:hypothetical protein